MINTSEKLQLKGILNIYSTATRNITRDMTLMKKFPDEIQ